MYDIFFVGNKNSNYSLLKKKFITIKQVDNLTIAKNIATTKMFWVVWSDLIVVDNFDFTYQPDDFSLNVPHVFLNKKYYDGVVLLPKTYNFTSKEVDCRFFVQKKEINIVASNPSLYDKFNIDTYDDYLYAMENTKTELFWATTPNIDTSSFNFDFYISYHDLYNRKENHVFKHRVNENDFYNGLFLLSKHKPITKREIEYRHLVSRKEHDIIASGPVVYDKFNIDTYDDYLYALHNTKTELFWATTPNIDTSSFNFDLYFTHDDKYNRKENHVFIHKVYNKSYYNGLFLLSKHKPITKREIEYRHLVSRKEWNIVGSKEIKYDKFNVETYDDYLYAMENTKTELFWATTPNIDTSSFNFDLYFTHDDEYNRKENHVFIHRVDSVNFYNGLFLLSKHKPITKREIEYRHLVSRKEHDIIASGPVVYDKFNIDTYDDYLYAMENTKTEMFYSLPSQITINEKFNFDLYFTHDDEYSRKENHVFKNLCNNEKKDNGVFLLSKYKPVTEKEINFKHLVSKKTLDIVVSKHKPYDVVFISYNEKNADKNYNLLLQKCFTAKRINGVKGIHQAHINAAKMCKSEMIWIVDADAILVENFDFDLYIEKWDRETVHVWRSKNPINDLVYGYGGVKLFPRLLTINMDTSKPDMTTSITNKFKAMPEISNLTAFNTDPFSTWKSAFRECCKLASKIIDRQKAKETEIRLDVWCSKGSDKPYGKYALAGATSGRKYGYENMHDLKALGKINDFDWLKEKFDASTL